MAKRGKSRNQKSKSTKVTRARTNQRLRSPVVDQNLLNLILNPTSAITSRIFSGPAVKKTKKLKPRIVFIGGTEGPTRTVRKTYSSLSTPVVSPRVPTNVCVRRQQRTEVLHATDKAGKSGQAKPTYNSNSQTHCKG